MKGVIYAILAAILFGITTPVAKNLLIDVKPVLLAGLFYLGSGLGLATYLFATRRTQFAAREASLARPDWPWLAGAIFAGGVIAPVLLMLGLATTQASAASLFLNLEGVFTALIAWFVFRENFDKRILLGMIAIVLGGVLLGVNLSGGFVLSAGILLIGAACVGWGIDNNLSCQPCSDSLFEGSGRGYYQCWCCSADGCRVAGLAGASGGTYSWLSGLRCEPRALCACPAPHRYSQNRRLFCRGTLCWCDRSGAFPQGANHYPIPWGCGSDGYWLVVALDRRACARARARRTGA
jgi:uncharacterized membrane protein